MEENLIYGSDHNMTVALDSHAGVGNLMVDYAVKRS